VSLVFCSWNGNSDPSSRSGRDRSLAALRTQDAWSFKFTLRSAVQRRANIAWDELLPPDDVSSWLAIDIARKRLAIDPADAVPDAS
jgi:hypothetical protein